MAKEFPTQTLAYCYGRNAPQRISKRRLYLDCLPRSADTNTGKGRKGTLSLPLDVPRLRDDSGSAPPEDFRHHPQVLVQFDSGRQRRATHSFWVLISQIAKADQVALVQLLGLGERIFRPVEVHASQIRSLRG